MKINFERMSIRQRTNLDDALNAYNGRNVISSARPPVLYIELTRNCIAKCSFCRPAKFVNSATHNMDDKLFSIIEGEYIPYAVMVDLRGWGESLMLPNLHSYVDRVASFNSKIRLTTTLACGNAKTLESLIENDVFLAISFDAATKEVYERIRAGAKYDVVMKNLKFITDGMLEKYGTLEGRIRLDIHPLQGSNLDFVEDIVRLAARHHIKEMYFGPLAAAPGNRQLLVNHKQKTLEVLRRCVDIARTNGIGLRLAHPPFPELAFSDKAFDLCCHPWLYAFINCNGSLLHCDHLVSPGYEASAIGHITECPDRVWNGERAQTMRMAYLNRCPITAPSACQSICWKNGRYAEHEADLNPQFQKWIVSEDDLDRRLSELGHHSIAAAPICDRVI